MKYLIIKLLHALTRRVLIKYKPTIIAITGSVGKSGTKEAVAAVLGSKYQVRKSAGNFNTEIGLPLTVLDAAEPGRSPFKWLVLLVRGLGLILLKSAYPQMLVLEMGADKPGDISELLKIVEPKVGLITAVSLTHTEQFGSVAAVTREKGKLFRAVDKAGWLVVNRDDEEVWRLAETSRAQIVTYGIKTPDEVTVRAVEIAVSRSPDSPTGIAGVSFKLVTAGTVTPVLLSGIIGSHQVYAALAAAAVGQIFSIHMVAVAESLGGLAPLPGRMRILPGIKRTVIIDDSYNSSPAAAAEALAALADLECDGKKYAVLGDMLELGALSEEEHKTIGRLAAQSGLHALLTVGERSRDIARGARAAGLSADYIFEFSRPAEAGLFLQARLQSGDVILIKASRGVHLEAVVREIMAEPERAEELLVH